MRDPLSMATSLRQLTPLPSRRQPTHLASRYPALQKTLNPSYRFQRQAVTRAAVQSFTDPPRLEDCTLDLDLYEKDKLDTFDLVVAGAGPSGLSVGARVAKAGFNVCVVDPCPLCLWPNNYGVWVDEFEAMGLDDCFDHVWTTSEVYLENEDPPKFLNRPYARVDRPKLKRKLLQECKNNGVYFRESKVDQVNTASEWQEVKCSEGDVMKARLVLDATGHSRKLIQYNQHFDPGYQGAYGYMATVKSHPFNVNTMVFMDWRDDWAQQDPELLARITKLPTFLYAMPFSETRIFLEETSLVAKPIAPFDDLKERLEVRLKHLGIEVLEREEEEYCVIPMGGVLPQLPQSIIGIGGTAGMVHPATGYMISRMFGAAPELADNIVDQLSTCKRQ